MIHGCNKCDFSGGFVTCKECSEGLYLLKNYTYASSFPLGYANFYPAYFATCVPDCQKAHASFVNDPVTGKCQWCGQYCQSCNFKYGCENCLGDSYSSTTPWTTTNVYSSELTSLLKTPSNAAKNPTFSPTFKECKKCDDTKRCRKCNSANPAQCLDCNQPTLGAIQAQFSLSGGVCQNIGITGWWGGRCYQNSGSNYFQQCLNWGGDDPNCDVCNDRFAIGSDGSSQVYNCGGGGYQFYRGCVAAMQYTECLRPKDENIYYCYVCDEYYGEVYHSNGNFYCSNCIAPSSTYFFERTKCSSSATCTAASHTQCTAPNNDGCRDGYSLSGECKSTCGVGMYGYATFNAAANMDSSYCQACDGSCYECAGAGPSKCLSCFKDYYLASMDTTKSYGTCVLKETYGTFSFTLYVNPITAWRAVDVQTIDGTSSNPYNQLQDAIKRAYEMAAPFKESDMTIILLTGTHAMIRNTDGFYYPKRHDGWSQNVRLTIKSQDPANPVVIRYKLRDSFKFLVGAGLTIQNVIFQAADSINTPYTQAQINCLADKNTDCCLSGGILGTPNVYNIVPPSTVDMTNSMCFFARKPTEQCYMPQGASFFEFDLAATPLRTQLTNPATLTITNVKFLNFLYEFNSFIEMNDHGGYVVIQDSVFENMNTCGSIIRNKRYTYSKTAGTPWSSYVVAYNERSRNYPSYLQNAYYASRTRLPATVFTCEATATCFSITITNTHFKSFGQLKSTFGTPIIVDPALKLQYSGSVLDLDNFKGDVKVTFSTFDSNILRYSSCDVTTDMVNNVVTNHQSADANKYDQINSGAAKSKLQIRSVISIVSHTYKVEIVKNVFTKNSGTKGIIYLDTEHRGTTKPVIIAHNTFTQNAGFIDSSVIYIRARGTSVDTTIPLDGQVFCAGYHFEGNTYTNNFGCTLNGGSVVRLECLNTGVTSTAMNDRITHPTLAASTQTSYFTGSFAYTVSTVSQSYAYNGVSVSVTYDMQKTTIKSETYSGNYGSGGKGLIDIQGMPRVFVDTVIFVNNGDSVQEVITAYGAANGAYQIQATTVNDMTITKAFQAMGSYPTTSLCQGLLRIVRCRQLSIVASNFDSNWLLEHYYSGSRAQLATLSEFYGEFLIDQISVKNQIGMASIAAAIGGPALIPATAANIQKIASMQPLFKWQSTDMLIFKPLLQTGVSDFTNILYQHVSTSASSDRLFWPALTSSSTTSYVAPEVKFNSVTFANIQCYACQLSPLFIHTQKFTSTASTMTNVNDQSYADTVTCGASCKQVKPFFEFNLRQPLTVTTYDSISVTGMQVTNYWGGCSDGRLFDFTGVAGGSSNPMVQVSFLNSRFENIRYDCNGGWARVSIMDMQMKVDGSAGATPMTFKSVYAKYTALGGNPGFGGVMLVESLNKLFLYNVLAEDFRVKQTTAIDGGGRFLYYKQDNQNLNLEVKFSSFRCSPSTTAFDYTLQQGTNLPNSFYDQGSCMQAESSLNSIYTVMEDSTIEHCYNSLNGGALFVSTPQTKTLQLTRNTFANNVALNGGAIYCEKCIWQTMLQNTFKENHAQFGGDLFIKEATVYPVILQSHHHESSVATSIGGAIFILDLRSTVTPNLQIITTTTPSELKLNKCLGSGCNGGAVAFRVQNQLSITTSNTNYQGNTAGASGAVFFVDSQLSQTFTLSLTTCTVTLNVATASASFLYVPNTATTSTVTISDTDFTTNSATNGDGGLFYLSAVNLNQITFNNALVIGGTSTIDTSSSGNNGGVFYLNGKENRLIVDELTIIKNVQSAMDGGLLYLYSTDSTKQQIFNLNGGYIENSNSIGGAGGIAYMNGISIHKFTAVTTNTVIPKIKTASSLSHGGAFYMNGANHIVTTTDLQVEDVQSSGEGGFLYSSGNTLTLGVTMTNSKFLGVKALTEGSIISMRKGTTAPLLTLSINSNSEFRCLNADLEPNIPAILGVLDVATPTSNIGGAFYFDNLAATSTVTTSASTFYNCYTANNGAIFYLPAGLTFTDSNSVFKQTAATKGGVIYCSSCQMTFTNSQFKDNIAQDGSILYMMDNSKATFTNPTMSNGKARRYGGAIYAGGTGSTLVSPGVYSSPKIEIKACTSGQTLGYFDSRDQGGFMYIDHQQMQIDLNGCSYNHLYALNTGGFIEGKQMLDFKLQYCTSMINITAGTGSFMKSTHPGLTFTLTSCNFNCDGTATALTALGATVTQGTLFELTNAGGLILTGNRFEHCYTASQGSIFKLTQCTSFTDTSSVYSNNAAMSGGAFYLDKTPATFTSVIFENNFAQNGGTFYLTGQQTLTLTDSRTLASTATTNGGFVYAQEPLNFETVSIVLLKQSATATDDYTGMRALNGDGGGFYLASNRVSLQIEGFGTGVGMPMKVIGYTANAGRGGLVYSQSKLGIVIKKADLQNAQAINGGSIYVEQSSSILVQDSTMNSGTALQKGGFMYIQPSANLLASVTMTNFKTYGVTSALSGSIIYSESATATFTLTNCLHHCKSVALAVPLTFSSIHDIGGAFFIKDAIQVTSTLNQIRYCHLSDTGGAFYLENTRLTDTDSVIEHNAAIQGGALTCKRCIRVEMIRTQFNDHQASQQGGLMYMEDTTQVIMDTVQIILAKAVDKGGLAYMFGTTTPASFTLKNSNLSPSTNKVRLEQLQAGTSGGGFYVDNPNLSISMIEPVAVKDSKALTGTGGFFHFQQVGVVALGSSTYETLISSSSGSFLYSVAPTLQLSLTSSIVDCTGLGIQASPLDLTTTLGIAVPIYTRGGAIYIKDSVNLNTINTLQLFTCYTGDTGGAFSLINTRLKDTSSRYTQNGAIQGGSVYCNGCWMELNDIIFSQSQAYEGGTMYLNRLMTGQATVLQQLVQIYNTKAFKDGGTMYVTGTGVTGLLDLSGMIIDSTEALSNGGMIYIDNPLQNILATDVKVTQSTAQNSGGVFFVKNSASITINEAVSTSSLYQTFRATLYGSFMYSESTSLVLSIQATTIQCQIAILPSTPVFLPSYSTIAPYQDRAGAFYIKDALAPIISNTNNFERCYACQQGGIFTLINSKLIDTASLYQQNAAINGGVFYLDDSLLDITSATIIDSYAANGGIVYKLGKQDLLIKSSIITNAYSALKGGLAYITEKAGFISPTDLFIMTISSPLTQRTTFTNIKSELSGGSFYIDSEQLFGINLDNVDVTNTLSVTDKGGFMYISKIANGLTISNSIFRTFSSVVSGSFLHSEDPDFNIVSSNSIYECSILQYDAGLNQKSQVLTDLSGTFAGAFYIKQSLIGVTSSTNLYRNCYTTYGGSIFTLVDTKLIDQGSIYSQNAGCKGGVIKCLDCEMMFSDSEIKDNDAYDGGVLYSEGNVKMIATRVKLYNNKARWRGGVLSVNNPSGGIITPNIIDFESSPNIYMNKADFGAFAYFDNQYIDLKIQNSHIKNHTAFSRSAFLEAVNIRNLDLLNMHIVDSFAPKTSVMHSTARTLNFRMRDSDVFCDLLYQDFQALPYINVSAVPSSTHNTKFYIEAAQNMSLNSTVFKMCATSLYGGVFWLSQGTPFYDVGSTFEYNAGANGGVIDCQNCQMNLAKTTFQYNQAWRGGAIELREYSYLKATKVKFDRNIAYYSAGVIYVNTFSYMEMYECTFTNNRAIENSGIEVLQSARNKNITLNDCTFEKNQATKNTISLRDSNSIIQNSRLTQNSAKYLTKHLFIGFSNVYIYDTQFKGGLSTKELLKSMKTEETLGSHLYAILSSYVYIQDSYFLEGVSKLGGAIFIEGNSTIEAYHTTFQYNYARRKGGAIYGSGFNKLKIAERSRFNWNLAGEQGDDIYTTDTEGQFVVEQTVFDNSQAVSSIVAENAHVQLKSVQMRNIGVNPQKPLTNGAGLSCLNCRSLKIESSQFNNLYSLKGGAIYLQEMDRNKLKSDGYGKYNISSTTFDSCSAIAGGAIYLDNPHHLSIGQNTRFASNKARNISDEQLKKIRGSGGAIYYSCDEASVNCFVDISETVFMSNQADIKGGAIHWDTLEPDFYGRIKANSTKQKFSYTPKYKGNKAGRYGDNISTFPRQIAIISESDYKETVFSKKPLTELGGRNLQDANITITNDSTTFVKNVSFTTQEAVSEQRSGGQIPKMYLALVDKYGQIVSSDDDSKINVMIDAYSAKDGEASMFPPFIEGSTQYEVQNGVVKVSDISFAATPGYNYSLRFDSAAIQPEKISAVENQPQNKLNITTEVIQQPQIILQNTTINITQEDLQVKVNISLRECEVGEQFQWNGKCNQCPTNTSFSLTKMDEPGECKSCPSDRAFCYGGTNIGPAKGYWRKSNYSANFIQCNYKPACLGMIPPDNNPIGSCAQGYQGILCSDCKSGYTRSRDYQCTKCPSIAWIIGRILLIIFCIVLIVFLFISAQKRTRYLHSYLRVLLNHIQLILIIATFNFNWPDQLQSFFDFSRPVSQPFSELLSLNCLIHSNSIGEFRLHHLQMIFLALLPIIFALMVLIVFKLKICIEKRNIKKITQGGTSEEVIQNVRGKMIQCMTILMFIAYPNIVQFMLYQFNCIDIDGVMRLKMDLEIVCWKTDHKFFTYYLALPSLIVWGLGLPILAFSLLTMNRAQIMKAHKQTQESYGFLFAGLKSDFYFWEIVITLRKLCLLAISILVIHYGVLTQALIVLLVLILFLVLTARKRPFINEALFDLEAISIATAMISVYCGLFYLADTSQIGFTNADRSSDVTFDLAEGSKKFLLASIIIVNAVFFIYWLWRVFSEMEALKGFILKTFPTLYLLLFTCGDKDQAYVDKHRQQVLDDNEGHKEEFMKILNNMKQLYSKGDLLLNTQVMERLRLYMNPQKILQIAGVVDSHDVELAKKIQEQLFRQYGVQVNNSNLTTFAQSGRQDGASFDKAQHKKSTIGSLLTEQYNEQAMMNTPQVVQEESVNYEDQNRYLNVLAALRNSQQEKEDFNPQKNNNQLYGDLLDFKYLDSQSAQSKGNQNQQMVSFRSKLDEIQNGQDQSSRYENASQAYNRQRSIPNSEFDGVVKHRTRMLSHIDSFKPPGTASTTAEKQIRQTNAFMRRSLITDEGRLIDEELESQQLDTREEGMKDTLSVQDSQAQVILPKKGGQQTALTKQNGTGLLIETGYPFE